MHVYMYIYMYIPAQGTCLAYCMWLCIYNWYCQRVNACLCCEGSEPSVKTPVIPLECVVVFLPTELSAMAVVNPTDLYVDAAQGESDNAIYEGKHWEFLSHLLMNMYICTSLFVCFCLFVCLFVRLSLSWGWVWPWLQRSQQEKETPRRGKRRNR